MPDIQAFRGVRYDLGQVGSLSDVLAPSYDVIDADLRDELYKRHPANCVRLILNREEPGDDDESNQFTRAARFLKNWRNEGVFQADPKPAIYVHHQIFQYAGAERVRRGFVATTRIEPIGDGSIFSIDGSVAVDDRQLRLTRESKSNLGPILGLYPDDGNAAQNLLEQAIDGQTPIVANDQNGVEHRVWPVTDVKVITELQGLMGGKPTYIADGIQSYVTAAAYRDELSKTDEFTAADEANFVAMTFVSTTDLGVIIRPTHRLIQGSFPISSDQLKSKIDSYFDCRIAGEGSDLAEMVWTEIAVEDSPGTIGLYATQDERWLVCKINDEGRKKLADLASEHCEEWQDVATNVLDHLVLGHLLDEPESAEIGIDIDSIEDLVSRLDSIETDEPTAIAAVLLPPTIDHIQLIVEQGDHLPTKVSDLIPRLTSGIVFHVFE